MARSSVWVDEECLKVTMERVMVWETKALPAKIYRSICIISHLAWATESLYMVGCDV